MVMRGMVYLVGAGPGDPDLITVKGMRLVQQAEVLVHDALGTGRLLHMVQRGCEVVDVGKRGGSHRMEQHEINELLVDRAMIGKMVVRLKGGDPFMFGRGAEEAERLALAGITVRVVPGVTSPIAAPELAGIPVTHRDHASLVTFLTGHESADREDEKIPWDLLVGTGGTLVILMGMSNMGRNMRRLIDAGMDPGTMVAVVENGSTDNQRTTMGTVADIEARCQGTGAKAPAIIVVGSVASLHGIMGDLF